jgi:RNA polymerase sigma-70 factor (ECF subfamily)
VEEWIRAGDTRRAAAWLVATYGSDVMATCLAMVGERAAAEDVTQDVFSDAFRALAGFRGESSVRTWLLSIARNRCIDHLRARKRDPWARPGDDDAAGADPDAHPDQSAAGADWLADRGALLRALDMLAEGDRALVTLRFRNGLEYDELATAFRLKEGTVRMRVSRALARMREVIGLEPTEEIAVRVARAVAAPPRSAAAAAPPRARTARAEAPAPPPGAPPSAGAGPARAPASLWSRIAQWAGGGARQPAAFSPPLSLGVALAACVPVAMSDALTARLAALVEAA